MNLDKETDKQTGERERQADIQTELILYVCNLTGLGLL